MSSNKKVKEKLIALYGEECFIEKLHLRKDKERHYTSKKQMKIMKQLTYHHIVEKSKGGRATVENGALLSEENHIWFHKQNNVSQAKMNKKFQEYKKCKVEKVDDLELEIDVDFIDFIPEEKEKYNRAKKKQEDRKEIDEGYNKWLDEKE